MVLDDHDVTNLEAISQGTCSIGHHQGLHPQKLEHSDWERGLARGRTEGGTDGGTDRGIDRRGWMDDQRDRWPDEERKGWMDGGTDE